MVRRLLLCAVVSLAIPALLLAQTPVLPQVEQSRQFSPPPEPSALQGDRNATPATALGAPGTGDDAFGTQVFLKRENKPQPFSAFAEIGAFVTNNVALVKKDREDDSFLVATTGAAFSQRFSYDLRVDASARASAYRYNKFSELNFQSIDLSLGVSWSPPALKGAEVLLRYTFTDLTTAKDTHDFYQNHAILLGVQKVVPFCRAQAVYFGASAQWSFADPAPAGRDEYSIYAGYRAQLTRSIDADLYYRYGRYVYREGDGRKDNNHTVSLGVHYTPRPWVTFSATGFYGVNRSNRQSFDYDVGNAGVGFQVSIRTAMDRIPSITSATAALFLSLSCTLTAGSFDEARVSRVVNDVTLVAAGPAHRVAEQSVVHSGQGLQLGPKSRAEVTFADGTLARLGAGTSLNLPGSGRDLALERGTLLLTVPSFRGGARVRLGSLTATCGSATILVEHLPSRSVKVLVLEGDLRISTGGFFGDSVVIPPGKMLITTPYAPQIPDPVDVDLATVVKTSNLIDATAFSVGGAPLASLPRIQREIGRQASSLQGRRLIPTNLAIVGSGTSVVIPGSDAPVTPKVDTNESSTPKIAKSRPRLSQTETAIEGNSPIVP